MGGLKKVLTLPNIHDSIFSVELNRNLDALSRVVEGIGPEKPGNR